MAFAKLSTNELGTVTGGRTYELPPAVIDPKGCSATNPLGQRIYTQSMSTAHIGPSLNERIEAAYDRAMRPWTTMNGLLSGVAGMGVAATARR